MTLLLECVSLQREYLEKWQTRKMEEKKVPPPKAKCTRRFYNIVESTAFEVIMNLVILVNVVFIIVELSESLKYCSKEIEERHGKLFVISNYVFLGIYSVEFLLKVHLCPMHMFTVMFVQCIPGIIDVF